MQNKEIVKQKNRKRIKQRIRKKISGTPERPRLVVFRGNRNVTAQLIDDVNNKVLATVTSVSKSYDKLKSENSGKIEISKQIGKDAAAAAKKINIDTVVFDRSGYRYHGRVKAIAEGAREGGLKL